MRYERVKSRDVGYDGNALVTLFVLAFFILACGCMECEPNVDFSPCENATGIEQDNCYGAGIPYANCKSTCDKIKKTYWKDQCYFNLAVLERDIKLCGEIENKTLIERCSNSIL